MFITDFELYLRTACKCGYNTTAKFMQFFKRIIIIARNNGILVGDPFASYKIRLEKVDRGYLTEDEIKIILKKKNGFRTAGTRQGLVRLFLFLRFGLQRCRQLAAGEYSKVL